jgi:hypothetical protein
MGRDIFENRPIPWDQKFLRPIPLDGILLKICHPNSMDSVYIKVKD